MPKVILKTNYGPITLELDAKAAPITTQNFLNYVESGFYDGTIFHRVIGGFMIQGGGFTKDMMQKPTGKPIQNEASNGLKNEVGTIAMARTTDPHSATAQFFINVNKNNFLDFVSPTQTGFGYCVFGKIVDGLDVVMKISHVNTGHRAGHQDVPDDLVIIESATVVPELDAEPKKSTMEMK